MSNLSKSSDRHFKKRPPVFVLLEITFLLIISLPNMVLICKWAPNVVSIDKLQSRLLRGSGFFIDVAKYYACAQIAKTNPRNIWDLSSQQDWFKDNLGLPKTIDLYATQQLSPAQYTPQGILLFMPLTCLPLNQAIVVFEFLSLLFLIIPVSLLLLRRCKLSKSEMVVWWLIILAAAPSTENFSLGQVNGYLAGLAAIFLLTWQNKNNFLAALSLALTIAIKPHRAFVLLIMVLAARKFNLLFTTVIISILLLGLTIMVLGIEPILKYPSALMSIEMSLDRHELIAPTELIVSVFGPISIIFGSHAARVASVPMLIICLSLIYFVWHRALAAGKQTYGYAYAASFLCNLVLGPHEHFYDLLLISVVWAMTIPVVQVENIFTIRSKIQRLWCILFLLFPAITWTIYFAFSQPPHTYFGSWHLPLLIYMLALALIQFKRYEIDAVSVKN
jgi:hypothetical protein